MRPPHRSVWGELRTQGPSHATRAAWALRGPGRPIVPVRCGEPLSRGSSGTLSNAGHGGDAGWPFRPVPPSALPRQTPQHLPPWLDQVQGGGEPVQGPRPEVDSGPSRSSLPSRYNSEGSPGRSPELANSLVPTWLLFADTLS